MAMNTIPDSAPVTLNWATTLRQNGATSSRPANQATPASISLSAQPEDFSSISSAAVQPVSSIAQVQYAISYKPAEDGTGYFQSAQAAAAEYTVSAPNPPGASASGATIEIAEYNLAIKLDAIA